MESYILDNSSTAKYQRLDLMSKILDPRSRDSLTVLGVCDGYPEVKTEVPNIRGTTRDAVYFQMFYEMVRDRVLDSGLVDEKTLDAALADPDYRTQCWMLTSVWFRKPLV
jgi:hypothetical protein